MSEEEEEEEKKCKEIWKGMPSMSALIQEMCALVYLRTLRHAQHTNSQVFTLCAIAAVWKSEIEPE